MKKLLTALLMIGAWAWLGHASLLDDLKNQIIDQTHITITEKGGAATFYDMSVGRSNALRIGVVSHVLTNRFISGDLGYAGGTDGHVDSILVGGPSIRLDDAFSYYFPVTAGVIKVFIPPVLQKLYVGANAGWGTDGWAFHYGFHLGYDF